MDEKIGQLFINLTLRRDEKTLDELVNKYHIGGVRWQGGTLENGVFFYPILVRHEEESWSRFKDEALKKFASDNYAEYSAHMIEKFKKNLA